MSATTSHGTRQPAGAESAGPLAPEEVVDAADNTSRAPAPKLDGKRVRAIPGAGGTTVRVTDRDFKANGIKHPTVVWDFRKDRFTVGVGSRSGQISQEAADFLTSQYPTSFEFIVG